MMFLTMGASFVSLISLISPTPQPPPLQTPLPMVPPTLPLPMLPPTLPATLSAPPPLPLPLPALPLQTASPEVLLPSAACLCATASFSCSIIDKPLT
ncbi:hypothetical protein PUN28_015361 [Cardiocondyla obscurior]|uniref:Uncharacterized protein n=1 Tax=Cardiocondyla obscurior TaxID=286306 RepID=A0AAW2EWZ5_9HYME